MTKVQKAWSVEQVWREQDAVLLVLAPLLGKEEEPDEELVKMLTSSGFTVGSCMAWEEDPKRPWRMLMFNNLLFYGVLPATVYNEEELGLAPSAEYLRKPRRSFFSDSLDALIQDEEMKDAAQVAHVVGLDGVVELVFAGDAQDMQLSQRGMPTQEEMEALLNSAAESLEPVEQKAKGGKRKAPAASPPSEPTHKPAKTRESKGTQLAKAGGNADKPVETKQSKGKQLAKAGGYAEKPVETKPSKGKQLAKAGGYAEKPVQTKPSKGKQLAKAGGYTDKPVETKPSKGKQLAKAGGHTDKPVETKQSKGGKAGKKKPVSTKPSVSPNRKKMKKQR